MTSIHLLIDLFKSYQADVRMSILIIIHIQFSCAIGPRYGRSTLAGGVAGRFCARDRASAPDREDIGKWTREWKLFN
jgi:hypothetical protein